MYINIILIKILTNALQPTGMWHIHTSPVTAPGKETKYQLKDTDGDFLKKKVKRKAFAKFYYALYAQLN